MSIFKSALLPIMLIAPSTLVAVELETATHSDTEISNSDNEAAQYWSLSLEQYQQYKSYMEKEGKYHYAHLDPVFVSGLIAENEQDRKQLAELYYQQELRRRMGFDKFNEYYRAYGKKVRGNQSIISVEKLSQLYGRDIRQWRAPSKQPQAGDRITYFVNKDCGQPCVSSFQYHLQAIGGKYPVGTSIDVYFIGFDRKEIEAWAKSVNLNPGAVKAGTVTLNFDDRYEKVFNSPVLPAAFLVRNNQVLGQL